MGTASPPTPPLPRYMPCSMWLPTELLRGDRKLHNSVGPNMATTSWAEQEVLSPTVEATTDLVAAAPPRKFMTMIVVRRDSALPSLVTASPTLTVFLIVIGKYLPLTLTLALKRIFLLKLPIEKEEQGEFVLPNSRKHSSSGMRRRKMV